MKKDKALIFAIVALLILVAFAVFMQSEKYRKKAILADATDNEQETSENVAVNAQTNQTAPIHQNIDELDLHPFLLPFCEKELKANDSFHAVQEGTKSLAQRVRDLTGLTTDGEELFEEAFNIKNPLLKINNLSNGSEKSEQKGFNKMLCGFFGLYRNYTAHEPRMNACKSLYKRICVRCFATIYDSS